MEFLISKEDEGCTVKNFLAKSPHPSRKLLRSLKFREDGILLNGARVTVRVAVADGVTISVSDNGPGIPEADRALVLQPFYRSSDTAAEGTGLGLPIVQEIARQHSATLAISDTDPDATPPGTCFAIRFQ